VGSGDVSVDGGLVEWLKQGALFASATDAAVVAAWGNDGRETEIMSCLALEADAAAEAARQLAIMKGSVAFERHDIKGLRADLIGKPVTITCDRLGYDAGLTVFVIDAEERKGTERTDLIVLRRLP
jgi:hypothetical protein